jgi:uncharacterized membrane protein
MKEIHEIHTLPGVMRDVEEDIIICKGVFKSSRINRIDDIDLYDTKTKTQKDDKPTITEYGFAGLFLIRVLPFLE